MASAAERMVPTPESHPREWAIFSQLDADGNGSLDIDEIYAYVSKRPPELTSLAHPWHDSENAVWFTAGRHGGRGSQVSQRSSVHLPVRCTLCLYI
jgi:hypothetical protein